MPPKVDVERALLINLGSGQRIVLRERDLQQDSNIDFVHVAARRSLLGQKLNLKPAVVDELIKVRAEKIDEYANVRNRLTGELEDRKRMTSEQKMKLPDVFELQIQDMTMRVLSTHKKNGPLFVEVTAANIEYLIAQSDQCTENEPAVQEHSDASPAQVSDESGSIDVARSPSPAASPVQVKRTKTLADFFAKRSRQ